MSEMSDTIVSKNLITLLFYMFLTRLRFLFNEAVQYHAAKHIKKGDVRRSQRLQKHHCKSLAKK